VTSLLTLKAQASEIGNGARIALLDNFIQREWAWADVQGMGAMPEPGLREEADAMFRAFVKAHG
jgi:hypothetical protein